MYVPKFVKIIIISRSNVTRLSLHTKIMAYKYYHQALFSKLPGLKGSPKQNPKQKFGLASKVCLKFTDTDSMGCSCSVMFLWCLWFRLESDWDYPSSRNRTTKNSFFSCNILLWNLKRNDVSGIMNTRNLTLAAKVPLRVISEE